MLADYTISGSRHWHHPFWNVQTSKLSHFESILWVNNSIKKWIPRHSISRLKIKKDVRWCIEVQTYVRYMYLSIDDLFSIAMLCRACDTTLMSLYSLGQVFIVYTVLESELLIATRCRTLLHGAPHTFEIFANRRLGETVVADRPGIWVRNKTSLNGRGRLTKSLGPPVASG